MYVVSKVVYADILKGFFVKMDNKANTVKYITVEEVIAQLQQGVYYENLGWKYGRFTGGSKLPISKLIKDNKDTVLQMLSKIFEFFETYMKKYDKNMEFDVRGAMKVKNMNVKGTDVLVASRKIRMTKSVNFTVNELIGLETKFFDKLGNGLSARIVPIDVEEKSVYLIFEVGIILTK